jgi:hypothetical protein
LIVPVCHEHVATTIVFGLGHALFSQRGKGERTIHDELVLQSTNAKGLQFHILLRVMNHEEFSTLILHNHHLCTRSYNFREVAEYFLNQRLHVELHSERTQTNTIW